MIHKERTMNPEFDVIVCGGGPSGFAASISAARNGARTLLIERGNCLGGMGTTGLVIEFARTAGANGGIFKELIDRMNQLGGINYDVPLHCVYAIFDPELLKFIMQQMCEEAGVTILFHTFIEGAAMKCDAITGVTVVNKSGRQTLPSGAVIDCTGDGDVAVSAGADYRKGNDITHSMQAMTLRIRIGGVNMLAVDWPEINARFEQERQAGINQFPSHVTKWLDAGGKGLHNERTFNLDMIMDADATNAWELSRAETEARKRFWEFITFAKKNIPGWENCYIIDTASHIGVRETRRIMGQYMLTEQEVRNAQKCPDGIARGSFGMDLHDPKEIAASPDPDDMEKHRKRTAPPPGEYYEIPYRCLIPVTPQAKPIQGLLTAGRCISADRRAGGSIRIMITCMNTGQAAGLAAAESIQTKSPLKKLDGKSLRQKLIRQNAEI